jgi:hypothetical protein
MLLSVVCQLKQVLTKHSRDIPGIEKHSCFLKSVNDVQKIRSHIMDCIETALLKDQSKKDIKRLLHVWSLAGVPQASSWLLKYGVSMKKI